MVKFILINCIALLSLTLVSNKDKKFGLPADAVIIEARSLKQENHPNRVIVLWMIKPTKDDYQFAPDDPYTCPDQTRGDHFSGQTRVSLVDTINNQIINTLEIKPDDEQNTTAEDTFDIPYRMRKGYYYQVEGKTEGKPTILFLKDYNGDGKALEFALIDALACMPIDTTLIGYSEANDKLVNYQVELTVKLDDEKPKKEVSRWIPYLFTQKPITPGYWKYEVDFRGRGGSLDKYEIRYNVETEKFKGELTTIGKTNGEQLQFFSAPNRGI